MPKKHIVRPEVEEEEAHYDGEFYRWVCPNCDEVNEEEIDPRNQEVRCTMCGWIGQCES